jgi:exonuclease SbcC
MRLLELELENFRQYASAVVPYETGITAIVGANGAGKTTLIEAVLWALYGTRAARGTSESLRFMWSQGGAKVRVRLDFQLGNTLYQLIRTEKDAALTQIQNGVHHTLARGISSVTDTIENLLGMNFNQFQTSFCARQKELEFMGYAPERRREEISRMLGYERIGKAIEKIADRYRELDSEVKGLQQGLGNRETVQTQIEETRRTLAQHERELQRAQEQLERAKAEKETIAQQLREAQLKKQNHDSLQNQILLLQSQHDSIEQRIGELRERWGRLQDAKRRMKEIQEQVKRYREVQRRLKELEPLAASETKRATLRAHIEQLQNRIEEIQNQLNEYDQMEQQLHALQPDLARAQQLETQLIQLRQCAQQATRRGELEAKRDLLQERLAKLQESQQEADTLREQMGHLEQQRKQLEDEHSQLNAHLQQLSQQWQAQRADLEARRRAQQAELEQQQERYQQLLQLGEASECPTCGQPLGDAYQRVLADVANAIETLQKELSTTYAALQAAQQEPDELAACRTQLQELETTRERTNRKIADQKAKYDQLQDELKEIPNLQEQLQQIQNKIEQIPPYDPEEERALEAQLQELRPIQQKAQNLDIELKRRPDAERELQAKQRELRRYQDELAQLPEGYDPNEHAALRQEQEQLQPLYDEALQISSVIKEESELRTQIEDTLAEKADTEAKLEQTRQKIESLGFSQEEYKEIEQKYLQIDNQVRMLESERASLAAARKSEEAHLAKLQAQLEEIKKQEELLRSKLRERMMHDTLREAMKAFRTELNQRLRPTLASYATEFLTHLTGGRYTQLDIDDEYRFHIVDDGMRKAVISGGEEDIVNLCMRLALARLITERAGQPLSLLILDEVFGSLDTDRRQNVLMLLNNLRDWFEQILIISHIEDINEAADRTLYVVRDERTRASRVLMRMPDTLPEESDLLETD